MKNKERITLLDQALTTLKAKDWLEADFVIAAYNLQRVLTSLTEMERKLQARPGRGKAKA